MRPIQAKQLEYDLTPTAGCCESRTLLRQFDLAAVDLPVKVGLHGRFPR